MYLFIQRTKDGVIYPGVTLRIAISATIIYIIATMGEIDIPYLTNKRLPDWVGWSSAFLIMVVMNEIIFNFHLWVRERYLLKGKDRNGILFTLIFGVFIPVSIIMMFMFLKQFRLAPLPKADELIYRGNIVLETIVILQAIYLTCYFSYCNRFKYKIYINGYDSVPGGLISAQEIACIAILDELIVIRSTLGQVYYKLNDPKKSPSEYLRELDPHYFHLTQSHFLFNRRLVTSSRTENELVNLMLEKISVDGIMGIYKRYSAEKA